MDKTTILNKIISYYNLKPADFASFIGVTPQVLTNWKRRNSYDPEKLYTKCIEFSPQWIISGDGPMLKSEYQDQDILISAEEDSGHYSTSNQIQIRNIPLYSPHTDNSLEEMLKKGSKKAIIDNFIRIPDLSKCDGAIYINDDSMQPLLKSGDVIVFKTTTTNNLSWGKMYLVEITENNHHSIFFGNLQKSALEGHIKLTKENPLHKSTDISLAKIKAIAIVISYIKSD